MSDSSTVPAGPVDSNVVSFGMICYVLVSTICVAVHMICDTCDMASGKDVQRSNVPDLQQGGGGRGLSGETRT